MHGVQSTVRPDCLLVEGCDFVSYPPGGQLACAKQLMRAFGRRLALVGICTDDAIPVGKWVERDIGGERFAFYGTGRVEPTPSRPFVPARLTEMLRVGRHRDGILSLGVRSALLQSPEDLLVLSRWNLESICYWFPGVANPLHAPRYAWGRLLARPFDRLLFSALQRVDTIVASADEGAIAGLVERSEGRLTRDRIRPIVTHYDPLVFYPDDRMVSRERLSLSATTRVVVCSGRLNRVKGWPLVVAAFRLFVQLFPDALLVFVGDGEDRSRVERAAVEAELDDRVLITGFVPPPQVAAWLNAADLVVVGSHTEGWSVAMLEALGCGKPLVSTAVSGASEMIQDGVNGFVVPSRSPDGFAEAMFRALTLPSAREASLERAREYDISSLAKRVGAAWPVLS